MQGQQKVCILEKVEGVQIWSCGGGTQSGAIAALIASGELPKPDLCYMTNTGRERSSTWPFVDGFIRPQLAKVGCELVIAKTEDLATDNYVGLKNTKGTHLLPGYTSQGGSTGKLSGFCSGYWKRDIAERYFRSIGVVSAVNWIGISTDEVRRVRTPHCQWLQLRYPLIFDVRMSRLDCVALIRSTGWTDNIPHSACYMCPNLGDDEWVDMKDNWPEDFERACQIERDLQQDDPHFWLHASCKPLAEVDFYAQHSMFADRGCTGGCFT
jgi:hypothetical protein